MSKNARMLLKEAADKNYKRNPQYVTDRAGGADHEPVFISTVVHHDGTVGQGRGQSVAAAEESAAADALRRIL